MTASEGEGERGKEGVAWSSPGIKSQWTLPDLWHNKHIIFGVALLSIECSTDTLWFLSLHADTTVSYPVWSTFWFRDESHRGTLKCTAPTPVPSGPWVNNDSGHCTPSIHPPPPAAVTQAQRAWPWLGVNNWHAGGCGRCCICHDASAVVLFIFFPGRVACMQRFATVKWCTGRIVSLYMKHLEYF